VSFGCTSTASQISEILEILTDGRWHMLDEIQRKTRLNNAQIEKIMTFLQKYEFVAVDETGKEVRLLDTVREFLNEKTTS
jgi:DNA-binding IclR family transcriptional regulator